MSQVCYANISIPLGDYGSCDPTSSTTFCCLSGQICLTNGLCVTDMGAFYNGACTDKSYKAQVCPRFCQSTSNQFVVQCHGAAVKDGDFCCSSNGQFDCCNTASNGLGLAPSSSFARAAIAASTNTVSSASTTITTAFISPQSTRYLTVTAVPVLSNANTSSILASIITKPILPTHTAHGFSSLPGGTKFVILFFGALLGILAIFTPLAALYIHLTGHHNGGSGSDDPGNGGGGNSSEVERVDSSSDSWGELGTDAPVPIEVSAEPSTFQSFPSLAPHTSVQHAVEMDTDTEKPSTQPKTSPTATLATHPSPSRPARGATITRSSQYDGATTVSSSNRRASSNSSSARSVNAASVELRRRGYAVNKSSLSAALSNRVAPVFRRSKPREASSDEGHVRQVSSCL